MKTIKFILVLILLALIGYGCYFVYENYFQDKVDVFSNEEFKKIAESYKAVEGEITAMEALDSAKKAFASTFIKIPFIEGGSDYAYKRENINMFLVYFSRQPEYKNVYHVVKLIEFDENMQKYQECATYYVNAENGEASTEIEEYKDTTDYINETDGFSFKIPQSWHRKYKVIEADSSNAGLSFKNISSSNVKVINFYNEEFMLNYFTLYIFNELDDNVIKEIKYATNQPVFKNKFFYLGDNNVRAFVIECDKDRTFPNDEIGNMVKEDTALVFSSFKILKK